jgi:hypothetical protein
MTTRSHDEQLTRWLIEERATTAPDGIYEATAARITTTSRRPGWLILDRWAWSQSSTLGFTARSFPTRPVVVVLVLVLLMLLAAGIVAIGALTKPPDAPERIPAARGHFRPTGSMSFVRENATATTLLDGRVLVIGGWPDAPVLFDTPTGEQTFPGGSSTAEIWDQATESFTRTGDLSSGRWSHAAIRLGDGRVLVVGGFSPGPAKEEPGGGSSQDNAPTTHAELWDPRSGRFLPAGDLSQSLKDVTAWQEPDGRVRVIGVPWTGTDATGPRIAQIWDPSAMTFTDAEVTGEQMPGLTLGDGRRLWVGGGMTALSWDPARRALQTMPLPPGYGSKVVLPDGRVLVAGGTGGSDEGSRQGAPPGCGPDAVLWDPETGVSTPTGSLGVSRESSAAALLLDGRVLVAGNWWTCDDPWTAEIFELR